MKLTAILSRGSEVKWLGMERVQIGVALVTARAPRHRTRKLLSCFGRFALQEFGKLLLGFLMRLQEVGLLTPLKGRAESQVT